MRWLACRAMTNPAVPPADSSKAGNSPEPKPAGLTNAPSAPGTQPDDSAAPTYAPAPADPGTPYGATQRFGEQQGAAASAEPPRFDVASQTPAGETPGSTAVLEGPGEPPPYSSAGWGAYPPEPPVTGFGQHHYPRHEAIRDRVWPHLVWELLLAVGVAVLFLVFRQQGSPGFESDDYKPVWWWASMLGLLAMGFSLSLRVGMPNLAIGSIFLGGAVLSSMIYREQGWEVWPSVATAVAIGAVAGLLLGLVIAVLHVPAWAASLGAGLAVLAWTVNSLSTDVQLTLAPSHGPDLFGYWEWIFIGIAGVSVLGGAIGAISALRTSWGIPTKADPATRPGAGGVLASLAGLMLSSALAAVAGGLLWIGVEAEQSSSALSGLAASNSDVMDQLFGNGGLIVLVLATVLLGGVSAFGRRGGIFGTMLATLAMVLLVVESVFDFGSPYSYLYLIAGALLLGLVVTRVLEASCTRTQPGPQTEPVHY